MDSNSSIFSKYRSVADEASDRAPFETCADSPTSTTGVDDHDPEPISDTGHSEPPPSSRPTALATMPALLGVVARPAGSVNAGTPAKMNEETVADHIARLQSEYDHATREGDLDRARVFERELVKVSRANGVAGLVATMKVELTNTGIDVAEVDEADSAITPDSPEKAQARAKKRDIWAEELRAAGVPEDKIAGLVIKRAVTGSGQRKRPDHATACHPEMIAFWLNRTDSQIEADILKLCRRDGGKVGPAARYEQLIDQAGGNSKAAANLICAHVHQRVLSIRQYVVAGINELRRRRAVAAGLEPSTVKYLRVTVSSGIVANVIDGGEVHDGR